MVGFKVCESLCIIFPVWENVNSVWYLNVVMFYIYIYMLYILLEKDIRKQKMSF